MTTQPSTLNNAQAASVYVVLDAVGPVPFHPGVRSDSRRAATPLAADLVGKLAKAEAKSAQAFADVAEVVLVPIRDQPKIDKAAKICREAQRDCAEAALALEDFLDSHRDEIIANAEATRDEARAVARAQADQLLACLDAYAEADSLVKALADRNKPRANGALTERKLYRPGGDAVMRVVAALDPPRQVIRVTPDEYGKLKRGEVAEDVDGSPVAALTDAVQVVYGQLRPRA